MDRSILQEGDRFSSFEEFSKQLKLYQQITKTQFVAIATQRLGQDDALHTVFKYRALRYQCKQGRRYKETTSSQQQPQRQRRSCKVGCPVMLNVRLNYPKNEEPFLKITKLVADHDKHEVSADVFQLYPEQRRIVADDVDTTVSFKDNCPARLYASVDKGTSEIVNKSLVSEHSHPTGPDLCANYPQNRLLSNDGKKKGVGDISKLKVSIATLYQSASGRQRQEEFVEESSDNIAMKINEQDEQLPTQKEMRTQKRKSVKDSKEASLSRWLRIAQRPTSRPSSSSHFSAKTQKTVTEEVKHHLTEAMLIQLGHVIKNCDTHQFEERLSVISDILELWEDGKTIWICSGDVECQEESDYEVSPAKSDGETLAKIRHIAHNNKSDPLPNSSQISHPSS